MTGRAHPKHLRLKLLCLSMAWIATASFAAPPDGGVTDLQARVQNWVIGTQPGELLLPRPARDSSAQINALLSQPLSADAAVRIAVLNNPDLQITLGAAGLSITDATAADSPLKLQARQTITALSAQAYKAWVAAVAAEQSARLLNDAKETLETSGELTRRMAQVGNVAKLTQARAQLALSEAAIEVARARAAAFTAREHLTVTLGLWGAQTQFQLPTELPALPAQVQEIPNVEERALQARPDLGLARTQWQYKQATNTPTDADGLWDALADAARVRASAIRVRSQAREAYFAYRTAFDIARHLDTGVRSLHSFVLDEMVLRYNGMLTSIFEVLADSHARTQSANATVNAQRDFWLAHADLQALLAGAPGEALKETP